MALRADFNVPLVSGQVTDGSRIERTIPTILALTEAGARVVILSHLGRPGGEPQPDLTLAPVAKYLANLLDAPVSFVPESSGPAATSAIQKMSDGEVALLENSRFLAGETANDPKLTQDWCIWTDHFVNDAFGSSHRAHASTVGLPRAVRAKGGMAVQGHLVKTELTVLGRVLNSPDRPFIATLGGAKISDKIDIIEALLPQVDLLLIGGAMANTFFRALGLEVGESLFEPAKVEVAANIIRRAGPRLVLPVDCVAGPSLEAGAETVVRERSEVEPDEVIGDIGPTTAALFADRLADAATVIWNGPMGAVEVAGFADGTMNFARAAATVADRGATVVAGGGDSVAAAQAAGVSERLTHLSTGGGASLAYLSGKLLPGIAALSPSRDR